jgi:hypothetical protein
MNRRKSSLAISAVMLFVICGNLYRVSSRISIRTVDFLSILALGIIVGIMISQIVALIRDKEKD